MKRHQIYPIFYTLLLFIIFSVSSIVTNAEISFLWSFSADSTIYSPTMNRAANGFIYNYCGYYKYYNATTKQSNFMANNTYPYINDNDIFYQIYNDRNWKDNFDNSDLGYKNKFWIRKNDFNSTSTIESFEFEGKPERKLINFSFPYFFFKDTTGLVELYKYPDPTSKTKKFSDEIYTYFDKAAVAKDNSFFIGIEHDILFKYDLIGYSLVYTNSFDKKISKINSETMTFRMNNKYLVYCMSGTTNSLSLFENRILTINAETGESIRDTTLTNSYISNYFDQAFHDIVCEDTLVYLRGETYNFLTGEIKKNIKYSNAAVFRIIYNPSDTLAYVVSKDKIFSYNYNNRQDTNIIYEENKPFNDNIKRSSSNRIIMNNRKLLIYTQYGTKPIQYNTYFVDLQNGNVIDSIYNFCPTGQWDEDNLYEMGYHAENKTTTPYYIYNLDSKKNEKTIEIDNYDKYKNDKGYWHTILSPNKQYFIVEVGYDSNAVYKLKRTEDNSLIYETNHPIQFSDSNPDVLFEYFWHNSQDSILLIKIYSISQKKYIFEKELQERIESNYFYYNIEYNFDINRQGNKIVWFDYADNCLHFYDTLSKAEIKKEINLKKFRSFQISEDGKTVILYFLDSAYELDINSGYNIHGSEPIYFDSFYSYNYPILTKDKQFLIFTSPMRVFKTNIDKLSVPDSPIEISKDFQLFPNPGVNVIRIKSMSNSNPIIQSAKIVNNIGMELLDLGNNFEINSEINTSFLSAGMYYLLIETNNKKELLPFSILR